MATRTELINLAITEGLDPEDADSLTDEELVDLYGEPEDVSYQDQGSLDAPIQADVPSEVASDIGTEELREEASRRVADGVNRQRERFPWELPPPRRS
jgi:hypothetical protein